MSLVKCTSMILSARPINCNWASSLPERPEKIEAEINQINVKVIHNLTKKETNRFVVFVCFTLFGFNIQKSDDIEMWRQHRLMWKWLHNCCIPPCRRIIYTVHEIAEERNRLICRITDWFFYHVHCFPLIFNKKYNWVDPTKQNYTLWLWFRLSSWLLK